MSTMGRIMPSALPWHLRFDWSRGCDEYGWGAPFHDTVTWFGALAVAVPMMGMPCSLH